MKNAILLFLICMFSLLVSGQNYKTADNLTVSGSHCCSECCVFLKAYYFLPKNIAIKKEDISNFNNDTKIGTWTCDNGVIEINFTDFYGGKCVGKKTGSANGCTTFDCDKYESFHESIYEVEIIELNNLPEDGYYKIDSITSKNMEEFNWITFQYQIIFDENDLLELSKPELRIKRNEIFARYGYIFKSKDLMEYFSNKDWYKPLYTDVQHFLTDLDKKYIELFLKFERK